MNFIGTKFVVGELFGTPGAVAAFGASGQQAGEFLRRHIVGDWGEVDAEDKKANDWSVANGERILSAYTLSTGVRIWIITEADRASTTILLPEEY